MPDLLLFALGVLVTGIVALAVWSVGILDVDDGPDTAPVDRGSRPQSGR